MAGYNTNYASSWHLVRSEAVFAGGQTVGSLKNWFDSSGAVQTTLGPLSLRQLDSGDVPATAIPLLGCGSQGDVDDNDPLNSDGLLQSLIDASLGLSQGVPVAESFNDGPSIVASASAGVTLPATGTPQAALIAVPPTGFPTLGQPGVTGFYLQDTRDWTAWHNNSVNLVFADGSVRSVEDVNKDNYINPGFGVAPGSDPQTVGYTSSETEVNPWDIFPGTTLRGAFPTKKFEQ